MQSAETRQPAFWWRGALILLPVALLAGVGLYSLRQDRALADIEARGRCQDYATAVALDLSNRLAQFSPNAEVFSKMELTDTGQLQSIAGCTNRAWIEFPPAPQSASDAETLYFNALENTNFAERAQSLAPLETNRLARTGSGLPLWLLAEFQRLIAQPTAVAAETLSSNAVNFPSPISEPLLEQARRFGASGKWLAEWRHDEASRDFYRAAASGRRQRNAEFWVAWRGHSWLAEARGGQLLPVADADVAAATRAATKLTLPAYARVKIEVAADDFASSPATELARSQAGPVRAQVFLGNPGLLYAQQRKRTLWFVALILASGASAAVGFVSAWRGYNQQLRLSEMKSNFVSCVSHELRAPIASMRLLAESLERGKVSGLEKQREYYQLLSQESRRLSALIENILDYSRIEQGRKTYEMEPADLRSLTAQTIALMAPSAAARNVELVAPLQQGGAFCATCDGLAVQQALINLIDNAVKHSPAGKSVAVRLEEGAQTVALSVADEGAGIPVSEHEKIFERFYRRGSELRRETQGIGIGLTIVKHIVNAHGGRVIVRSALGSGSCFIMEIPK